MLIGISIGVALLFAVATYLMLGNILLSLLIGILYALVLIFVVKPIIDEFLDKNKRRHECYRFVYSFIVSLSTNNSGEASFDLALQDSQGEEKEIVEGIRDFSIKEKLQYLSSYYLEDYYRMFLSIYQIYEEQGGDVLSLAEPLINEVAQVEKSENSKNKIRMNYLIQFLTLWGMSLLILVSVRFGLSSFYSEISSSILFVLLTLVYFLMVIGGIVYFAVVTTGIKPKFKGVKFNGKKKTDEE
ncbi:MAG: hypothetical protein MJ238_02750 [Bacilli bacterium]|nr:hypothetical protein [Bacilli bacterium]